MLRRWDDSQRFLSEHPPLICEETANYLILWSFRLQSEQVSLQHFCRIKCILQCTFQLFGTGFSSDTDVMCVMCLLDALQKEALMEQVAHQAVVMQFILEMAKNAQEDPRGCFRQFFQKAKVRFLSD